MDFSILEEKTMEIARLILSRDNYLISLAEIRDLLGQEFQEFENIIREAICSNEKFDTNKGRLGGLCFVPKKRRQASLSKQDIKQITSDLKKLHDSYLSMESRERSARPEKEVEEAFKKWLQQKIDQGDNPFNGKANGNSDNLNMKPVLNFRSNSRRASKWRNVDGYLVDFAPLKYHLKFKPILTTFEVKADLPRLPGFLQAMNYLSFSHYSYLVFKLDRDENQINLELEENKNGLGAVGIFYTNDGIDFKMFRKSEPKEFPNEIAVDQALDELLSEEDKETILTRKFDYSLNEIVLPSIK